MSKKWAHAETSDEEEEPQQQQVEVAPPAHNTAHATDSAHSQPRPHGQVRSHAFKGMMFGLDYNMKEKDLENFLHSIGIQVRHLDFHMNNGSFTGRAVVTVANDTSMQTLLDMDGGELHGRIVHTKVYEDRQPRDRGGRGGGRDRDTRDSRDTRDRGMDRGDRGAGRGRGERGTGGRGPRDQRDPRDQREGKEPAAAAAAAHQDSAEMMGELRSMRGLIEQRFGALAFMEKLQRHPRQAQLSQRLLDAGFYNFLVPVVQNAEEAQQAVAATRYPPEGM
eukprot:gene40332-49150_t